ncbi:uncharacterized histidine-rich protein DDB_G0274557-like [Phlebotomus papatasi]|uniref:Uncharacterized protein n=1 Tax=Phlebotomus papatasi TaxID=29031 RepID=A0A1B0DCY1_PHLPP|nr:uncharacterized histidine-rich protein DDB_G0274557-like [Phlebotomus papatasi]
MKIIYLLLALIALCAARVHHHKGHRVHFQASHEHDNMHMHQMHPDHQNMNHLNNQQHQASNHWFNVPHYDYYGRQHQSKPHF